jgi:hypothetical protein
MMRSVKSSQTVEMFNYVSPVPVSVNRASHRILGAAASPRRWSQEGDSTLANALKLTHSKCQGYSG